MKMIEKDKLKAIAEQCGAKAGDLVLVLCGKDTLTRKAMSELRLHLGDTLGMRNPEEFKRCSIEALPRTVKLINQYLCKSYI